MKAMRGVGFVAALAVVALVSVGCVMPPSDPPPPAACAPGTFSASGTEPCTPAPIGTYVAGTGATAPTACPANTTTLATGSTSAAACVQVPAFTWNQTVPRVNQSAPFTRTVTSGITVSVTINCTGTIVAPIAGTSLFLRKVSGVSAADVALRVFPRGSPPVCGGTYTLNPTTAASNVYEAGNVLVVDIVAAPPAGTTFTVAVSGDLGAGPTQVLNLPPG